MDFNSYLKLKKNALFKQIYIYTYYIIYNYLKYDF